MKMKFKKAENKSIRIARASAYSDAYGSSSTVNLWDSIIKTDAPKVVIVWDDDFRELVRAARKAGYKKRIIRRA